MEQLSKVALKSQFEETFPEYAKRMESAKNPEEAENIYQEIVGECYKKMKEATSNGMLKDGNEATIAYISPEDYENYINARGNDIEYYVTNLLNSASAAKKAIEDGNNETAAALMLAGGVVGLGVEACGICYIALKAGATSFTAALKAVTGCWKGIMAVSSFIITLILIPILYFVEKPATTALLVINDTDERICMVNEHQKHGKQVSLAKDILPSTLAPGTYAGIYVNTKKSCALLGTATGFHFQLQKSKKDFYIGVECPLSSIYGDNNCVCSATGSEEAIADSTHSKNVQEDHCNVGDYKCSIYCSNKHGSLACYIARIYK